MITYKQISMFHGKKLKDLSDDERREYYREYYKNNKQKYNKNNSKTVLKHYYANIDKKRIDTKNSMRLRREFLRLNRIDLDF